MGGREHPKNWEVRIFMSLFKKGDISNCVNYRGITLSTVVLKLYESIIKKRAREILDKQLEESQSGFRKRRSCRDHIIKTNFEKNTCA